MVRTRYKSKFKKKNKKKVSQYLSRLLGKVSVFATIVPFRSVTDLYQFLLFRLFEIFWKKLRSLGLAGSSSTFDKSALIELE